MKRGIRALLLAAALLLSLMVTAAAETPVTTIRIKANTATGGTQLQILRDGKIWQKMNFDGDPPTEYTLFTREHNKTMPVLSFMRSEKTYLMALLDTRSIVLEGDFGTLRVDPEWVGTIAEGDNTIILDPEDTDYTQLRKYAGMSAAQRKAAGVGYFYVTYREKAADTPAPEPTASPSPPPPPPPPVNYGTWTDGNKTHWACGCQGMTFPASTASCGSCCNKLRPL